MHMCRENINMQLIIHICRKWSTSCILLCTIISIKYSYTPCVKNNRSLGRSVPYSPPMENDSCRGWALYKYVTLGSLSNSYLGERSSYHNISWSLEAARFGFRRFQSLWTLTGNFAAALPKCLSNFWSDTIIITSKLTASRLYEICGKTSFRLVNRDKTSTPRRRV